MIANKSYAYDFNMPETNTQYVPNKKDFKIIKNDKNLKAQQGVKTHAKAQPKSKLSLVLSVLAIFTMLIVISYRYNLISEKNLSVQRLKMEKQTVDSVLATTEVNVGKIIDKDTVESYAKQQLGMQKPEKSQIVYINSDYEAKVEQVDNKNIFEKCLDTIKNLINM